MTTVVFGARGNVGSHVVSALLAQGERVRATSRDPARHGFPAAALKAAAEQAGGEQAGGEQAGGEQAGGEQAAAGQAARRWDGVEVAAADLAEPATLPAVLDGAERAFLYAHPEGIDGFVTAARAAGLRRVVLLSTAALARPEAAASPIARRHRAVEEALEGSGLEWTFVRAGMFATNTLAWAPSIAADGRVGLPYPEAQTAPLHEADIAAVAATALMSDGHHGRAYTLWGPESLTLREQVAAIAAALGRPIAVETITHERARAEMTRTMPEFAVDAVLRVWRAGQGHPAAVSTLVPEVTGRPARTYAVWARDHAQDFLVPKAVP
ncbi:NAD(P)H-binding protein [Actinoplanes sp. CA-142083]|uniref:NAD(P)H-binding protein n=1 Tax=Actinoplanes sp. CA-142083 TaxID=3239903 RepID=UPI003D8B3C1F